MVSKLKPEKIILIDGKNMINQAVRTRNDENMRICDECEREVDEEETYWIETSNVLVCEECYDYSYFYCEFCGNSYDNEECAGVTLGEERVCHYCGERRNLQFDEEINRLLTPTEWAERRPAETNNN